MFDPNEFLNETVTGQLDTKIIPVPENMSGDGYLGLVEKVDVRQWVKKDDPSISGLALDILWEIQDENIKTEVARDKVIVKQGIMLQLTESGQLDMSKGKNVPLGKLREALDMNKPGEPFNFNMIVGRMGKLFVSHRVVGENVYAEVGRVEGM